MNAATTDTSIWLALRNPVFRNLWLATVISGVCVAAHNTAAFSVLGKVGDSALLISLMSTLSALPFALFTLPAGAFADMVDRKKILCAVNLWQALIALGLTILGLTHYLNPYIILASTFLFNLGFAFGSPASSSVVTEMVSREELASANTLGGLQINISGMIGPVLNFEPASVTIFSHDLNPMRLSQAQDNPVSVTTEFLIDPARRSQCIELMREVRLIYLRNGASRWHLYEDLTRSDKFLMEVVAPSWNEYLRERERMTKDEKEVIDKLCSLRIDPNPTVELPRVSVDKEVLKKRARSRGVEPKNLD